MTFRANLETYAQVKKGKLKIPPELIPAYVMDKQKWDIFQYRATPSHVIEELLFLWHLQEIASEAANKAN
jgi:hypothetical protein